MSESSLQILSFLEPNGKMYDVDFSMLDFGDAPLSGIMGQLDPGTSSRIHNHFEVEIFLFISGSGVMHADGKKINVIPGMGIKVSPFINHVIENTNTTESLRFVSIYWSGELTDLTIDNVDSADTTLIFSTPPTPNGDMHLGHLSGPYLAADIYHRYLRQCGLQAFHVTGRDDHQTYIAKKAYVEKLTSKQIADRYSNEIRKTLHECGITIDYFIEPNQDGEYASYIKYIFKALYEKGFIVEKSEMAAFSAEENRYLHEAYIRGKCPFCQRDSDGNACEECGRPNSCVDLIDAYDRQSNRSPLLRPHKRLYFIMSRCAKQLDEYIKSTPMSAHALALSQSMLAEGLPDICVSHPNEWGIPVPVSGFEDQAIYVWFEMAAAYLWGAMQLNRGGMNDIEKEKEKGFYHDSDKTVVHFYGFDNTYYHTLLFPSVYFALGLTRPPSAHVVNELLDLNGCKFSTSRGHAVWARDLLKVVPIDYMRWFLCEIRPEGSRTDFTLSHFALAINHTFSDTLHSWTTTLAAILKEQFHGIIPEAGAWTTEHQQFLSYLLSCRKTALNHYSVESYSLRGVVQSLKNISEAAFRFTRSQCCLIDNKSVRDYLRTSTALSLLALKIFALISRPIIPTIATQLLKSLGIAQDTHLTHASFVEDRTEFNVAFLPNLESINANDLAILDIK